MNKIILIGNLTRDPELKTTPNGYSVCEFTIAVNDRRGRNQQSGQDNAQFFRIENGKMVFAMNTAKTVDLEAKRWYSVDIVECYENGAASWSAYVDGVKVFDGADGFKFTKLGKVNVVKQSAAGADFSIDNVTFAVSNYEPEITADEIALASSDATNVKIQNTYPRLVSVKALQVYAASSRASTLSASFSISLE